MEESFRRTIQLAIDGGLPGQHDICQQVLQLSKSCPLIFNSILKTAGNKDEDIDDFSQVQGYRNTRDACSLDDTNLAGDARLRLAKLPRGQHVKRAGQDRVC
jgi:hypothetical protein